MSDQPTKNAQEQNILIAEVVYFHSLRSQSSSP